ncbi:MAG: hypothetical protein ACE5FQ_10610 [Thiogranum sp.]
MRKNFNRSNGNGRFAWLRLAGLLVLLPGLIACDSLMLSSESPVIHLTDVSPQSLPGRNHTWSWDMDGAAQAYIRLFGELDEQLVIEFLIEPPDWSVDEKLRVVRPYTGYLTPLQDDWYMAAFNAFEDGKAQQGYLLVRIDENGISIPSKQSLRGRNVLNSLRNMG